MTVPGVGRRKKFHASIARVLIETNTLQCCRWKNCLDHDSIWHHILLTCIWLCMYCHWWSSEQVFSSNGQIAKNNSQMSYSIPLHGSTHHGNQPDRPTVRSMVSGMWAQLLSTQGFCRCDATFVHAWRGGKLWTTMPVAKESLCTISFVNILVGHNFTSS